MITFLSGGTGTPKLIQGMRSILPDEKISVVVNTAEDIWMSGNHISPDIDTVMYLFSGRLNTDTWWGIDKDTFRTHEELVHLGVDEYIAIGDLDRAVQIARGDLLREGATLTRATQSLCSSLGVKACILPMSDDETTTMIQSGESTIHFQEFWIKNRGKLPVDAVIRSASPPPRATTEVLDAISGSSAVIIGPSNPVTSILPILECQGVIRALLDTQVLAVSPFIGDSPVSGPAGVLMKAIGHEPNSLSTRELYREFLNLFIQDIRDPVDVPGSVRLDTLMTDEDKSTTLAREIIKLI
jgi:LPPG:FO 2-phospho-L-lactate transferase